MDEWMNESIKSKMPCDSEWMSEQLKMNDTNWNGMSDRLKMNEWKLLDNPSMNTVENGSDGAAEKSGAACEPFQDEASESLQTDALVQAKDSFFDTRGWKHSKRTNRNEMLTTYKG